MGVYLEPTLSTCAPSASCEGVSCGVHAERHSSLCFAQTALRACCWIGSIAGVFSRQTVSFELQYSIHSPWCSADAWNAHRNMKNRLAIITTINLNIFIIFTTSLS